MSRDLGINLRIEPLDHERRDGVAPIALHNMCHFHQRFAESVQ
jgi:hypothetical protein